jgi:hypothetical protein
MTPHCLSLIGKALWPSQTQVRCSAHLGLKVWCLAPNQKPPQKLVMFSCFISGQRLRSPLKTVVGVITWNFYLAVCGSIAGVIKQERTHQRPSQKSQLSYQLWQ